MIYSTPQSSLCSEGPVFKYRCAGCLQFPRDRPILSSQMPGQQLKSGQLPFRIPSSAGHYSLFTGNPVYRAADCVFKYSMSTIYIYWRRSSIFTFHLLLGLPKFPPPFCFVYQNPVCNFIFHLLATYRLFYWSWSHHTRATLQYTVSSS